MLQLQQKLKGIFKATLTLLEVRLRARLLRMCFLKD